MIRYRYEQQVAALLLREECVVIPRVGGLMVSSTPARILEEERRIIPPGKSLSFNTRITDEKDRLAKAVAHYFDLEEEIAITLINSESKNILKQLDAKRKVLINGVGEFSMNENGQIQFTDCPPQESVICPELGLQSVDLPAAIVKLRSAQTTAPALNGKKQKNWMKIAASLALPLIAGLGFLIQQSPNAIQLSDLGIIAKSSAEYNSRGYLPTEISADASYTKDFNYSGTGYSVLELNNATIPVVLPEAVKAEQYKYQLIGGCFADINNANAAVSDFKANGYDAFISEFKHGLYRVCIGKFNSNERSKK